MATAIDPATKPKRATTKVPARARKATTQTVTSKSGTPKPAAPKAAMAKRTTAKRAARKAAAPATLTQKITAKVTAAEHGIVDGTAHAVEAVKATASRAAEAVHAPDAAKAAAGAVTGKVRAIKPALRKAKEAKPTARRRTSARKPSGVGTGTVLGVAAAGLAAGLVVNLGRKAAVQAPSVMAGDWFEALKAEHKAALALLDKLAKSTPEQPARRTMLLTQLKHALGKHAFTEENVVYPALREWGDKADADALNHEQGYHKQFLYELDGMDKSAPEFAQKIADFRADLSAHIREEEDKIFPKLHSGLSAEKNKALTAAANKEGFKLA